MRRTSPADVGWIVVELVSGVGVVAVVSAAVSVDPIAEPVDVMGVVSPVVPDSFEQAVIKKPSPSRTILAAVLVLVLMGRRMTVL